MHDSRINYVVVGAFVTAMVVALVVTLSVLAGRTGATDTYFTTYDNVTGIKFGTAVMFEGYPIGQVSTVSPASLGVDGGKRLLFKVEVKVQRGWKIPEDSLARAAASGLLSAMTIDIRGGKSTKLIAPGGEIPGVSSSNFFATLSDLSAEFGQLSNESLRPMLRSLTELIEHINQMTRDSLPPILKDVHTLTTSLAKDAPDVIASVKHSSEILEKDLLKPDNIHHIDESLANFDETTRNLARFTGELDQTRKAINEAMTTLNKTVQGNAGNIDESMRDLRYTMDTLARYIDEIAQNAAVTTRNMAEFSRSIRNNPGLLLGGGDQPDDAQSKAAAKKK